MIQNHIKIAWRNILKSKMLSGIHVFGLTLAIATATLLYLTAMFELSFDEFHEHQDEIGEIYLQSRPNGNERNDDSFPEPAMALLKAEMPGIAYASRFRNSSIVIRHGDKQIEANNKYVDADFLSIFSFPILRGDEHALQDLDNIVLDENTARSLFNSSDVVGQPVEVYAQGQWKAKNISAVVSPTPSNSSIQFHSLLSFERKPDYLDYKGDWSHDDHQIFVRFDATAVNDGSFSKAAQSFVDLYYKDKQAMLKRDGALADAAGKYLSMHVLPLDSYHLNNLGIAHAGSPLFPWILLLIAGLILFIACSNFINLSLANSFSRHKEIGTRKTLGGSSAQLIAQLWTESLLLCVIALIAGLAVSRLVLHEYNAYMNYDLQMQQLFSPLNLLIFIAAFLLLTLLAGGYPAWRIARMTILQTLKGKTGLKSNALRNSLTVVQFSIAIVLIIATIVVSNQLHYLSHRPLGFNKAEVISIPIGEGIDPRQALDRMRHELEAQPWVVAVSASDINIGRGRDGDLASSIFGFEHEGKQVHTHFMCINYDYLKTLDIQLLSGRDFDRSFPSDTTAILINQQMAEQLGGAEHILGKTIDLDERPQVIGIIKDFNFRSLQEQVVPLTLSINPHIFPVKYIFVRVQTDDLAGSMQAVEKIWKQVNPKANIAASYLDENTQNFYKSEQRFSRLVITAAGITIVISCLGLFALALLMINRRVKEIGIRKVLGSSVSAMVVLLSKDFVKLVGLAFLIATPIAYWLMSHWLDDFAYHISIDWWMLALAGVLALFIALLTVSTQAIRAAKANPVESLRDE